MSDCKLQHCVTKGTLLGRKKKIQNASKPDIYYPEYYHIMIWIENMKPSHSLSQQILCGGLIDGSRRSTAHCSTVAQLTVSYSCRLSIAFFELMFLDFIQEQNIIFIQGQ